MSDEPADPVVVVGAGRVGLYLARALADRRRVNGVVVRSEAGRARVVEAGLDPLALDDAKVREARTVLLCVADDDLPELVRSLVPGGASAQFVAHTSGRHGLAVLGGLPGPVAAVHPAMTFTGTAADDAIPRDIVFGVTATGPGLAEAAGLVTALGGRLEVVPDERRALYHAAIVHAANHLNTLIADAADLLRASGVEDTGAVLGPIARAALANALDSGTAALTGPVVRGDVATVAAHLDALAAEPAGQPYLATYRAMALRTADRAEASGRLGGAQAEAIRAVLASGG